MDLTSLYQQLILDHYKHPIGAGLREPFEAEVHHVNPSCGDEITLRVHVTDAGIEDVSYDAKGCSISVAATSVMADTVTGLGVEEAMSEYETFKGVVADGTMTDDQAEELGDAAAFAGVAQFPARVKCALLGWSAMRDAVSRVVSEAELNEHTTKENA
ncbi:MAG: Fe-S cluster assembly sulfur transfer protein SufU [Actinomycetales bacterium]